MSAHIIVALVAAWCAVSVPAAFLVAAFIRVGGGGRMIVKGNSWT